MTSDHGHPNRTTRPPQHPPHNTTPRRGRNSDPARGATTPPVRGTPSRGGLAPAAPSARTGRSVGPVRRTTAPPIRVTPSRDGTILPTVGSPPAPLPLTTDLHALSRTKARESLGRPITVAGKHISRLIKTAFHKDQVTSFLRDGVEPPGHQAQVAHFAAMFRPSSPTHDSWEELQDNAASWIRTNYTTLEKHYSLTLEAKVRTLRTQFPAFAGWPDAWELGVRWATQDLGTPVPQRTLQLAMALLPSVVFPAAPAVTWAAPVSARKAAAAPYASTSTSRRSLSVLFSIPEAPLATDAGDTPMDVTHAPTTTSPSLSSPCPLIGRASCRARV